MAILPPKSLNPYDLSVIHFEEQMSKIKPQSTALLSNESFPFMFSVSLIQHKISQSQIPQQESPIARREQPPILSKLFSSIDFKFKSLNHVLQLHAPLTTGGLLFSPKAANKLLGKYVHFGDLIDARLLFDRMPERNLVSWNVMIDGFAREGDAFSCFETFRELIDGGLRPDDSTLCHVIKGCKGSIGFHMGRLIHCFVIKDGFGCDCVVVGRLIEMYKEFGKTEDSKKLLDEISTRETKFKPHNPQKEATFKVSGIIENSQNLFDEMPSRQTVSDSQISEKESTFILVEPRKPLLIESKILSSIINKCKSLHQVKQAHCYWVTSDGMILSPQIGNKLLRKYVHLDDVFEASRLFNRMPNRDLVSWNLMIHGFIKDGNYSRCFEAFRELIKSGVRPDHSTFSLLIKPGIGFHKGRSIHCFIIKDGLDGDGVVSGRLADMYNAFGMIEDAKLCNEMATHNNPEGRVAIEDKGSAKFKDWTVV